MALGPSSRILRAPGKERWPVELDALGVRNSRKGECAFLQSSVRIQPSAFCLLILRIAPIVLTGLLHRYCVSFIRRFGEVGCINWFLNLRKITRAGHRNVGSFDANTSFCSCPYEAELGMLTWKMIINWCSPDRSLYSASISPKRVPIGDCLP